MTRKSFVLSLRRTATSSTAFVTSTRPWEPGGLLTIDAVSVTCLDSKNRDFHVGVRRGGVDIYLESLSPSEDAQYRCTKAPIVVPSDYKVIVKHANPAAGQKYVVNIFAHLDICDS